jgi:hypothetical protein
MSEKSVRSSAGPVAPGALTAKVLEYDRVMRELVPNVTSPANWEPLNRFIAVEDFERVGTFMEVQDWDAYTEMLTGWANAIDSFETSVHRISEVSNLVHYEIEERHHRGDKVTVVNSLTVFEFDDSGLIRHLDAFLQQPRD